MGQSKIPILANAGTATGLLLAEAKREDLMAHPEFQGAVAGIRKELVKSLTASELTGHPQFEAIKAQAVADGVKAAMAGLTPEQITSQEPFKTVLEAKVRESIVTSENAKSFVAMLKDVTQAQAGEQTHPEPNGQVQAQITLTESFHEDSAALDRAARQIMAGDKAISYGDALIAAAGKVGYRKGGTA